LNFGLEKQLDRIVETLALSALMQANYLPHTRMKAENRLKEIAFPLEIELEEVPEGTYPKELFK